jgi:hypothetical protein
MTITAQRLLAELGKRAWSGFNADDMEFDNEDSLQAQTAKYILKKSLFLMLLG